jgi:hypothetical protein
LSQIALARSWLHFCRFHLSQAAAARSSTTLQSREQWWHWLGSSIIHKKVQYHTSTNANCNICLPTWRQRVIYSCCVSCSQQKAIISLIGVVYHCCAVVLKTDRRASNLIPRGKSSYVRSAEDSRQTRVTSRLHHHASDCGQLNSKERAKK